ncbi:hypothetical protein FQN57_002654 [Myotisia sp. PD_48]|nr:hypothetical protein FQN57_002654 [Myotisia sp. PD_48]
MDVFDADETALNTLWTVTHECDSGSRQREVLPSAASLAKARSTLVANLPSVGIGFAQVKEHIFHDITPGLNSSSVSPNYYGFVTGGVTPAALLADNVVSAYDQNVQVHLPDHSVATDVEFAALGLLKDLFGLERDEWPHAALTTGATASNLLGLSCGREFVLRKAAEQKTQCKATAECSVGEHGLTAVLQTAGLRGLQVLSTMSHSSLSKAAGILGIGRANVKSISAGNSDSNQILKFDFERLEAELCRTDMASIVAVSCGEVNTGRFATEGLHEFQRVRELCNRYNAWLHVDGAFGMFTRLLDDSAEFELLKKGSEGLELADSITGDAHKLLNVPYDCGFFFSRHGDIAENVFQNPNAAYLSAGNKSNALEQAPTPSPLNIGVENSRRFRALPVYATLVAYGKDGYRDMMERQISLARRIAGWLFDHPKYTVLPLCASKQECLTNTFMIVLFKANDEKGNSELTDRINATSKIFVSGTKWQGSPASRIAISNWKVQVERDFVRVTEVLNEAVS